MHTNNKNENENDNQTNAALAVNIQTAIALWETKDWPTYKTTRDMLLALIRSGRGNEVGIGQMQFIYFVNTHLRHRFVLPMSDQRIFLTELPVGKPAGDQTWTVATEGRFWADMP